MLRAPVSFRFKPEVLALARRRAKQEHRSLTNYIESLILRDAAELCQEVNRHGTGAQEDRR